MKIIVNARFLTQPITGVQRFAIELAKRLKKQDNYDIQFFAPSDIIHHELANDLDAEVIGQLKGHLWEQIDLPRYLRKNGNPLLLNLCSTAPCFYKNQIVTHHDITYIRCPESFSVKFKLLYKLLVPLFLKNSKKIITVSEFSKGELSHYFDIPKEKFLVIYNAVDKEKFYKPDEQDPCLPKYILAVSSQNYHKNFQGLVDAFNTVKDKIKNVDLYIVGNSGIQSFSKVDLDMDESVKDGRIHFLGRIDDDKLVKVYQEASLFVFPSFYEGFGIPPIEAQACGCPVMASDQASMPEILADSVMYFNPFDSNDLSKKLIMFFNDTNIGDNLSKKGIENIGRFDWDLSMKKILNNLV